MKDRMHFDTLPSELKIEISKLKIELDKSITTLIVWMAGLFVVNLFLMCIVIASATSGHS